MNASELFGSVCAFIGGTISLLVLSVAAIVALGEIGDLFYLVGFFLGGPIMLITYLCYRGGAALMKWAEESDKKNRGGSH